MRIYGVNVGSPFVFHSNYFLQLRLKADIQTFMDAPLNTQFLLSVIVALITSNQVNKMQFCDIPVGEADDHEEKMQTPTTSKTLNFKIEGATISA